jgi:hypothetical protein
VWTFTALNCFVNTEIVVVLLNEHFQGFFFFRVVLDLLVFSSPPNLTTRPLRGSCVSGLLQPFPDTVAQCLVLFTQTPVGIVSVTYWTTTVRSSDQIGPPAPSFPGHGRTHRLSFYVHLKEREGERNWSYMLYKEFHGSCVAAHVGIACFEMGFLWFWWRRRRACLICIEISDCLQFRTVSNFTLSPISHCLQFRTLQFRALSPISLCLQFRTVSNFALSPIAWCVSSFTLCLQFRTVSNFVLFFQFRTASPSFPGFSSLWLCLQFLAFSPNLHINLPTSH